MPPSTVACVDEAFLRPWLDCLPKREKLIERAPVGGRRQPVEEAGISEYERARAHTGHERSARLQGAQARTYPLVAELRPCPTPPGVDERVDRSDRLPCRIRKHPHALRTPDRPVGFAYEHDLKVIGIERSPRR
jgi:hypothetical protein